MPLVAEITRNGKNHVPEGGWSELALCAFITAAISEHDGDLEFESGGTIADLEAEGKVIDFIWANPIYLLNREVFTSPLIVRGEQTLLEEHTFGEIKFLPGDRFKMWRK